MPKHEIPAAARLFPALLIAAILLTALPATPSRGSEMPADPTITLDVQNEPLRSVLERISRKTGWKIIVPERWMDKPITQRLDKVSMEEGLRFILKDAGIENLLLTYDEGRRTVAVYDPEMKAGPAANRPAVPGGPPLVSPPVNPPGAPVLSLPEEERGSVPRRTRRVRSRRSADEPEE